MTSGVTPQKCPQRVLVSMKAEVLNTKENITLIFCLVSSYVEKQQKLSREENTSQTCVQKAARGGWWRSSVLPPQTKNTLLLGLHL